MARRIPAARRHVEQAQASLDLAMEYLSPRDEVPPPPPDRDPPADPPPDRDPPDDEPPDREPPDPPPPSRDTERGARVRVPRDLEDKTGYGSGWGNSGDAIYLTGPDHDLIDGADAEGVLQMSRLDRVRLRPGYRSGMHSPMGTNNRYNINLTTSAMVPAVPNGPDQNWKGTGTLWGARMYGIHSGLISNVEIRDWYGDSYSDNEITSREGHGFYLTLSQTPRAELLFEDLTFDTLGGHGIFLVGAVGDRAGNAPAPARGGSVVIDHSDFVDTDRCQARGSYCLQFVDIGSRVVVSNCNVMQDSPIYKNSQLGPRSRGLVAASGNIESLTLYNNYFGAATPNDRHAQIWLQGPDTVTLTGNTFDCPAVSINHPYKDTPDTIHTQKFVFRGNKGNARVEWKGQYLGLAHELDGEWTL